MKTALRIGWILLCLGVAVTTRCWNLRQVFVEDGIFFVDADCYSRMTRARMVDERPGTILRRHDFENWPDGVVPHATAPLDYLIVGLKGIIEGGFAVFDPDGTSVLRSQALDLAGALISPLLGLAGALFLALWLWRFRVRFWEMALLFYASSPILAHGTLLGRPDHQALLIFLLTIALGAELALVALVSQAGPIRSRIVWGVVSGAAWALSTWVSLYEPLVLLGVVLCGWLVWQRRALWACERFPGALLFFLILVAALGLEGWRVTLPDATMRESFAHWQQTIGELAHLRAPLLFAWLGWGAIFAPVLLYLAARTDRRAALLFVLLAATFALTFWQVRWGYFLALVFAWALPWQMQAMRRAWIACLVFVVGSWPILQDWDRRLFPGADDLGRMEMQRAETVALRNLVTGAMREDAGAFLAPWWLSPSIAYWTGQPGVAGSSHQSLPGIVDTARFYLRTDPASAAAILRERRVRWVLADEAVRVVATSAALLGIAPPAGSLAPLLAEHPQDVPEFLREWQPRVPAIGDELRFYRLYRVDDAKLPP